MLLRVCQLREVLIFPLAPRPTLGGEVVHLGADRLLRDGGILGAQIGQDFVHDIAVTRFLEIGRDHVPSIGQGGVPGEPQLFGRPQSEQFVATGFDPESRTLSNRHQGPNWNEQDEYQEAALPGQPG